MLQRILMIIILLAIVLGGGFYAYKELMPPATVEDQGPVYSTKEVVRGDMQVGVETVGQLNPSQGGGIRVPESSDPSLMSVQYILEDVLVEEGDEVKKGQVVAKLLSTDLESEIENVEEQLKSEREYLSEITGLPIERLNSINPLQGIQINSPIKGRVVNLKANEGEELSQGHVITHIVDDSRFKVDAKLTPSEFKQVEVGDTVNLKFPYFDGVYEGTITEVNPNPIPNDDEEFGTTFVHRITIEGKNPGLVQPGMKVNVSLPAESNPNFPSVNFIYTATVESFVKEEKVFNQIEAIVTEVHVNEMELVEKGDPLITMAGTDVREMIQEKVEKIRELESKFSKLSMQLKQMEVKAPMDGVIAGIFRQPGENVRAGEWIGDIYNTSNMRMYAEVDDIDVLLVKQGAPVKVTVDALPGETFEGKVERISTYRNEREGIARFTVYIEVKGGPQLRPGMQAHAFIDAGSAEDTLLIPLEAVFEEDGISKVEVLNDDGTTKVVNVKLGLMNDRLAEVKSGLKEGDLVITGSTADLLPSQHIKSQDTLLPVNNNGNNNNGNTDSSVNN